MNIDEILEKDKHKDMVSFAHNIVKYDKILLQKMINNKLSYEETRDEITKTFANLRTFGISLYEFFYRQLILEQISFSTFDCFKQEIQNKNHNEDTSGSFVESYIMSALDREAIVLTKQSFNRFIRTFFLVEAYRMKPLKYLSTIMNKKKDLVNAKNGKVELITDLICNKFNDYFRKDERHYKQYREFIKNNNDTTSKEFFWEVL